MRDIFLPLMFLPGEQGQENVGQEYSSRSAVTLILNAGRWSAWKAVAGLVGKWQETGADRENALISSSSDSQFRFPASNFRGPPGCPFLELFAVAFELFLFRVYFSLSLVQLALIVHHLG